MQNISENIIAISRLISKNNNEMTKSSYITIFFSLKKNFDMLI